MVSPKAVWSIPYVSVSFFPSLKQNFIAYHSSKASDCIFESHQLWQSGFRRVYSNCCCSCWFEPKIIRIGQSSHNRYSNNIVNFQESTSILNANTKKIWKLIVCTVYITLKGTIVTVHSKIKLYYKFKNYKSAQLKKHCGTNTIKKEKKYPNAVLIINIYLIILRLKFNVMSWVKFSEYLFFHIIYIYIHRERERERSGGNKWEINNCLKTKKCSTYLFTLVTLFMSFMYQLMIVPYERLVQHYLLLIRIYRLAEQQKY